MNNNKLPLYKHTFFAKSNEQADKFISWHQELKASVAIDEKLNYEDIGESQEAIKSFVCDLKKYFGIDNIDGILLWKNGLCLREDTDFIKINDFTIRFVDYWFEADALSITQGSAKIVDDMVNKESNDK